MAVKYVKTRDALRRMRVFLDQNDSDADLWRERQSAVAQKDFYLLDMDNGAGWKFIKGAPRCRRRPAARSSLPRWLGEAPARRRLTGACVSVAGLIAPRNKRTSVAKALKDPFLNSSMSLRLLMRNRRN